MYTVLIADDEPNTRRGLSLFVDWTALGCTIVAQAEDGLAARDYLAAHSVDIVITDIRMPGMDGLQLSKYIYEHHPETCVILLTAYADFSYAQSAIQYDVVDFVIKIDPAAKITEAVGKAKETLLRKRRLSGEIQQLQSHLTALQGELQETFLRDVLHRTLTRPDQLQKKADELGIASCQILLILCRFYPSCDATGSDTPHISALRRFFMQTFPIDQCISVCMDSNTFCLLLLEDSENKTLPCRSRLETICKDGLELTGHFTQTLLRIGISAAHSSVLRLPLAQAQAEQALTAAFCNPNHCLYFFGDVWVVPCQPVLLELFFPALESAIRKNDNTGARSAVRQLMAAFQASGETAEQIKLSCGTLSDLLTALTADAALAATDIADDDTVRQLQFSRSMAELEAALITLVQQTIFILHADTGRDTFVVRKIKEYIQCNYHSKDITLQSIADHVYLNSSYMSRLYKKTTGESLIHSIHKLRMEKAKRLLSDPSYRISQIASAIGIDDSSYFTSLFTKYEGASPTEYRNKAQ